MPLPSFGSGNSLVPGQASNQYFSTLPSLPSGGSAFNPTLKNLGKGFFTTSTIDPALTNQFLSYLGSQTGRGAAQFQGAGSLPTGAETQSGQLSANLDPILQMFSQFFTGEGEGTPGLEQLLQISKGGTAIPTFNATKDAMQRNIDESRTNLREQFGFAGNLASSPFGTAATDFESQTSKDFNSILANLQFSELGHQLDASKTLAGLGSDIGQFRQGLDQEAINRAYDEFIRTRPEYNPLLQYLYGASTQFPPVFNKKGFGLGAVGGILSGAGSVLSGIGDIRRKN